MLRVWSEGWDLGPGFSWQVWQRIPRLSAPYAWKSRLTSQLRAKKLPNSSQKKGNCNEHSPSKLKYLFLASFLVSFSRFFFLPPAMHILKCIEMQIARQLGVGGGVAGGE